MTENMNRKECDRKRTWRIVSYANDLLDGNYEKYDKSVRPSFEASMTT